jgi:hypothetical protein
MGNTYRNCMRRRIKAYFAENYIDISARSYDDLPFISRFRLLLENCVAKYWGKEIKSASQNAPNAAKLTRT